MIVKVVLGTMQNAKKLVNIAEGLFCDAELSSGRYVVDAKSMLGVLSLPDFEVGELHIHTENETECGKILEQLRKEHLLMDIRDAVRPSLYDIVAFGEILIDFTSQGVHGDGQTLYARNPGGAPANVAVAAGRLGARTAFLGKAGRDMHGEFLRSVLQREQVDTRGLILDHTNIFHVGSLSLTDQPAEDTTFYAVKRAKAKGSVISYDPNYRASLWKDRETAEKRMRSLLPYVDLIKISEEETELLTGYREVSAAAEALYRQGVKVIAVTLGEKGAYLYCREGGCLVPGFQADQVKDTNGAGDSFWGGFLYRISISGKRPEELTKQELAEYTGFANAVASLCVEKKGAIPAMPHLPQVKERLKDR